MDQNNKMTPPAEQAETENAEQRIRALEEREAALDLRERTARCRAELQGRDLPDSLIACLDLSSDERADAGLEALAATINEEAVTLEDVYEPFLLQNGFLTRTMRGRCVTRKAYEHLGIEYLGQQSMDL